MNENEQNGTNVPEDKIIDIVQKKKRGAKWTQELTENGIPMEPGENARYIRNAMVALDLPPIDISDPEQVRQRLIMYFKHCAENDRRPQVVGMCNWLGISRNTLNTWKNEEYRTGTHSDIIKKAYGMLEEMWVDYMQNGKISPPTAIFLAKNFFHYKDVADVVVTPNNPYQAASDEELSKKYLTDMVTDEE